LDVPYSSILIDHYTEPSSNVAFVSWSISRTNIPPPGNYYGELLAYGSSETNVYRSIAQGTIAVTWSLYLNETNYFSKSTTNASVGQVYLHPNWITPLWITNEALFISWLSTNTYVHSNSANWDGTWKGYTTNFFVFTNDSRLTDARTPLAHNQDWSTITGEPNTVSGYGITDTYTKVESDNKYALTGSVGDISADVNILKGKTSVWDTAKTDSSYATNFLNTNTLQSQITTHVTNQSNPHLVTAAQAGAVGTNDARYLAALTNESLFISVSNSIVFTNTMTFTDAVAKANASYPSSNPSNFVTETVTNAINDILKTKVATNDATYTDTVAKAISAYPSSNPSNFVSTGGDVYTVSNNTWAAGTTNYMPVLRIGRLYVNDTSFYIERESDTIKFFSISPQGFRFNAGTSSLTANQMILTEGALTLTVPVSTPILTVSGGTPTNTAVLMVTNSSGQIGLVTTRTCVKAVSSQTTNTTDLVITGVGFRPIGCQVIGAINALETKSDGFIDAGGNNICYMTKSDGTHAQANTAAQLRDNTAHDATMTWKSWDADGATFTRASDVGSITSTVQYIFLFFR
jgi:hypothetical protein